MANYSDISKEHGKAREWAVLENPANLNSPPATDRDCGRCIERLSLHGVSSISNSDLLAILLCCGFAQKSAVNVSRKLLNAFDDLSGLDYASVKEISMAEGFCHHKAATIKAAIELGKRLSSSPPKQKHRSIEKSWDIARVFMPQMKRLRKEVFKVAILDTKNRLAKSVTISEGGLAAAVVSPREVFSPAVREMAHGVILVHNHPSGDPAPSKDDIKLTRRLVEAGKLINIEVLDHIVIGDGKYYSFLDEGDL